MVIALWVGAVALTIPSLGDVSGRPTAGQPLVNTWEMPMFDVSGRPLSPEQVEAWKSSKTLEALKAPRRLGPSRPTLVLPRRGAALQHAPESKHRDDEGGAVILEMGADGIRKLHCEGHTFHAVVDAVPEKTPETSEDEKK